MTSARRLTLALLWLGVLLVAGWWIGQHLHLSGDLRKFMPRRKKLPPNKQIPAAAAAESIRMRAVGMRMVA